MAATKFSEIRKRNPVSADVKAQAHMLNLAEHTGLPLAELRRLPDLTQLEVARRLRSLNRPCSTTADDYSSTSDRVR